MAKYFISHSSKDKEIVNEFLDILEEVPIPEGSIFCTSRDGDDITTGDDFVNAIKDELSDAEYVFACFSQCYIDSPVCMAEIGAGWIKEKENKTHVIPIIIDKNFSFESMTPLFRNIQGAYALNKEGLNKFFDDVIFPEYQVKSMNKWLRKIDKFLKFIESAEPQTPNKVPYSLYQKLQAQNKSLEKDKKQLMEKLEISENKSKRLSKAETQEEKDEILREYSSSVDTFEEFRQKIVSQMFEFQPCVRLALFRHFSSCEDLLYSEANSSGGLQDALDYEYLVADKFSENIYKLNVENDEISKVISNIKECADLLDDDVKREIKKRYGISSSITNKRFWQSVFNANF